jgi:hypothetical protein
MPPLAALAKPTQNLCMLLPEHQFAAHPLHPLYIPRHNHRRPVKSSQGSLDQHHALTFRDSSTTSKADYDTVSLISLPAAGRAQELFTLQAASLLAIRAEVKTTHHTRSPIPTLSYRITQSSQEQEQSTHKICNSTPAFLPLNSILICLFGKSDFPIKVGAESMAVAKCSTPPQLAHHQMQHELPA